MSETNEQAPASPEDLYPPRPGGMVDTARRQRAAQAVPEPSGGPAERPQRPVPVKTRQPGMWGAKTLNVAPGASAQAMPADALRKRGLVNLVTAGTGVAVLVARDRSSADSGTGYMLLAGQPPLEVGHTREVWLSNPGDAAVQVSVLTESYQA